MRIVLENEIDQPAERVWTLLSDFGELGWQSRIVERTECSGQGVGMTRIVHFKYTDAPSLHRLDSVDELQMKQSYTVRTDDRLMPVSELRVCEQVVPRSPNSCCLQSSIEFNSHNDDYEKDIQAIYESWAALLVSCLKDHLSASKQPGGE